MTIATPSASRREHKWPRNTGLIDDPYAWLINQDDPEVMAYLGQENNFADAWFVKHHGDVDSIFEEIKTRVKQDDATFPVLHNQWWYSSRTHTGQAYAIHYRAKTLGSETQHLLLDENLEASGHSYFSLSAFDVSYNNRLLAWSSDNDGAEKYTLRIRDIDSGVDLADTIENTTWGGTAWSRDDSWLFYVVADEAMRPWQVWRHEIGTATSQDHLVFQEPDERFFVGIGSTRSGRWITIETSSKTSSETWIVDSTSVQSNAICIAPRQENVEYQVDHWGDTFAIVTNKDAQDFQVVLANEATPEIWESFITHTAGERISGFDCFENCAILQRWKQGQQVLSVVGRDGTVSDIEITTEPHEADFDVNPDWSIASVRLSYQSLTTPMTIASFDLSNNVLTTLKRTEVLNVDVGEYVSERVWTTSQDGTSIPLDYVRHRNTPVDGSAPALLYVYGSYEISTPPWFSIARLSLLDRGWIWALAHPRGGGEMGRQWYEDGKLLNKKNTFKDTITCANYLADSGICSGAKIVIRGGSAGGLAVGACITMAPARFAGAIAEVPFVDVTNTMCDPSLPLTVTEWEEWGDPRSEPYFSYISSYSPYDNVQSVLYPSLYITSGLNDPRVSYHEPAKWAAKIRYLSPETTVVFTCEMGSGHGGPSGRYEQWREEAKTLTFAIASVNSVPRK